MRLFVCLLADAVSPLSWRLLGDSGTRHKSVRPDPHAKVRITRFPLVPPIEGCRITTAMSGVVNTFLLVSNQTRYPNIYDNHV